MDETHNPLRHFLEVDQILTKMLAWHNPTGHCPSTVCQEPADTVYPTVSIRHDFEAGFVLLVYNNAVAPNSQSRILLMGLHFVNLQLIEHLLTWW